MVKDIDVKALIDCSQRQWTSGIDKTRYCQNCPDKQDCQELLKR